jgi:hypothetical protein
VIDLPWLAIALWQFQVALANFRLLLPVPDRGSFPVALPYQVTLAVPVARCGSFPAGRSDGCTNTTFEYNLIPFSQTLQKPVWFLSANSAGSGETCKRGEKTRIANP